MGYSSQQKWALFTLAAALRLALFFGFPSLPDFLTGRVEVSTPVTSFKRLQEGLFLHTHDVSPYDGGVFYQSPLLLALFSFVPESLFSFFVAVIYTGLDLLSAQALVEIAESRLSGNELYFKSPRRFDRWGSLAVAAAYLLNPLTVASCLGRTTTIFSNYAILLAIVKAIQGKPANAVIALSMASYLSMYPILLLAPLVLLSHDVFTTGIVGTDVTFMIKHVTIFFGSLSMLLGLSIAVMGGSTEFLASTYGNHLLLVDLTPNIGVWWYFFIEMFDSFREFFLGVFWLHLLSYSGGLSIRLRTQPLFVLTTLIGLMAVFIPYPSISNASLYLGMFPLYRHTFPLMRTTFIYATAILYAVVLGPAFYYLWIYAGSGNANFFYAITLVWSLGLSLLIGDSVWAVLRDEWEVLRPEMKDKPIQQI